MRSTLGRPFRPAIITLLAVVACGQALGGDAGAAVPHEDTVFESGKDGYRAYRIPAVVATVPVPSVASLRPGTRAVPRPVPVTTVPVPLAPAPETRRVPAPVPLMTVPVPSGAAGTAGGPD